MICFPNAKINLGLNVVSKRTDGYHNIETVFYPILHPDRNTGGCSHGKKPCDKSTEPAENTI